MARGRAEVLRNPFDFALYVACFPQLIAGPIVRFHEIAKELMFGFHFPENFRRPYSSISITDFWRRWHLTLSNWFRDYLYIPLGGNRGTPRRTSINLIIVFLATGIWHGANWTFIVWGMMHGATMLWERQRQTNYVDRAPHQVLARARTFLIVLLAWVMFRAESLTMGLDYYQSLLGMGRGLLDADGVVRATDLRELAMLAVGGLSLLLPRECFGGELAASAPGRWPGRARVAVMGIAFPVTILLIVSGTFSPFLYFQF